MCDRFCEENLARLRERVKEVLSPYRFSHTLGVEKMIATLGELYAPEKTGMLRAAALLHDVTKEEPLEKQREILEGHAITLRPDEAASPKIHHGITAALEIPTVYPEFAHEELISAVRWHTTARADLTLTEALLYLADYIEEGRSFADCVALRERFFSKDLQKMTREERERHLWETMLLALDLTLLSLRRKNAPVCLDTLAAWEQLKKITAPKGAWREGQL